MTLPLRVPAPVREWVNVADVFDVIALDGRIANDFDGGARLIDVRVDDISPNNHAACGYLSARAVRGRVGALVVPA
ncbi:MAG: hypothetical protein ACRDRK_21470 [Pseudonocardia sp.]